MIKALEDAIEKVRSLSEERQRYAASVLEQLAEQGVGVWELSDEERQMVREGLADLDAGRIVPDAGMEAFWQRHCASEGAGRMGKAAP
jgi:predicted transcriptional regulator